MKSKEIYSKWITSSNFQSVQNTDLKNKQQEKIEVQMYQTQTTTRNDKIQKENYQLNTARTEKIFKKDQSQIEHNFLTGRPSIGQMSGFNSNRAYNKQMNSQISDILGATTSRNETKAYTTNQTPLQQKSMKSIRQNNQIHIESNNNPLVHNQNIVKEFSAVKDVFESNRQSPSMYIRTQATKFTDKKKSQRESTLEFNLNKLKNQSNLKNLLKDNNNLKSSMQQTINCNKRKMGGVKRGFAQENKSPAQGMIPQGEDVFGIQSSRLQNKKTIEKDIMMKFKSAIFSGEANTLEKFYDQKSQQINQNDYQAINNDNSQIQRQKIKEKLKKVKEIISSQTQMHSPYTSRKNESSIKITDKIDIVQSQKQNNLRKYLSKKNESTMFKDDKNMNKTSKRIINKNQNTDLQIDNIGNQNQKSVESKNTSRQRKISKGNLDGILKFQQNKMSLGSPTKITNSQNLNFRQNTPTDREIRDLQDQRRNIQEAPTFGKKTLSSYENIQINIPQKQPFNDRQAENDNKAQSLKISGQFNFQTYDPIRNQQIPKQSDIKEKRIEEMKPVWAQKVVQKSKLQELREQFIDFAKISEKKKSVLQNTYSSKSLLQKFSGDPFKTAHENKQKVREEKQISAKRATIQYSHNLLNDKQRFQLNATETSTRGLYMPFQDIDSERINYKKQIQKNNQIELEQQIKMKQNEVLREKMLQKLLSITPSD